MKSIELDVSELTWGQFKHFLESNGVSDDTHIDYMDFSVGPFGGIQLQIKEKNDGQWLIVQ